MTSPGSNDYRREQARKRVEAKIAVLEEYFLYGVPKSAFVPRSIEQFRKWQDKDLSLEAIGSPNTLNRRSSPGNIDLINKVNELMGKLNRKAKAPRKPRQSLAVIVQNLRNELGKQERINSGLSSRLHELKNEITFLQDSLALKTSEVTRLRADLQALRQQFAQRAGKPKLVPVK